jgi:formylglycine-generating enzyme required for sulfatase activity/serine/threonine protein kinase
MSNSNHLSIPGYEIIKVLGKGGMGTVYLAIQSSLNRQVALKVINPTMAEHDATFNKRFVMEANATAALSHTNIITIYDSGEFQKYSYMAMEYISSGTLADMDVSKLSIKETCLLFINISRGLSNAHKAGFVHRDIKPENILIAKNGNPIVTDFGIVKNINTDDTALTERGTTIGTPEYMSPEQITDMAIDGRSDLYSLGVVMYNLLEGRVPFEGKTSTVICIKHVKEPPPPLSPKNKIFQTIISKLLEKNPDNRYKNADELITDLKQLMDNPTPDLVSQNSTIVNESLDHQNTINTEYSRTQTQSQTQSKSNIKLIAIIVTFAVALLLGLFIYDNYLLKQEEIQKQKISQLAIESEKDKKDKAKQELDKLNLSNKDKDKWFSVSSENSPSAYQSYLDIFPNGIYSNEARIKIKDLNNKNILVSDNIIKAQSLLSQLGYQINFNGKLDERTIASIKDFENKHNMVVTGIVDGVLITHLKQKYSEQDENAWNTAKKSNTIEAYKNYRKNYSEGLYISQVDSQIIDIKNATLLKQKLVDEKKKAKAKIVKKPQVQSEADIVIVEPKDKPTLCIECPEMVVIPPGTFQMGSDEGWFFEKPIPVHQVTIKPFAMSKTEITFDQWEACFNAKGCQYNPKDKGWGRGDRPVISVNWNDAQEYINWLNNKTGKKYRLPSEAEWEYAARAGSTTHYSWGNEINCGKADYQHSLCNKKGTSPVKSYQPNKFGLYDMNGNVAEWIQDCWTKYYNNAPIDGSPRLTGNCNHRVLRGGAWNAIAEHATSHFRFHIIRTTRWSYFGFRIAMDM